MVRTIALLLALLMMAAAPMLAGCSEDEPENPSANGNDQPVPPPPPIDAPADRPVRGVDDRDDPAPQVQGIFPKTGSVLAGQWVKRTPVTYYDAARLNDMVDRVSFYEPYGVDWGADCQYLLGNQASSKLIVELFHCRDSGDAYGLMSVHSDRPAAAGLGQEARGGNGVELNIWKGNYFLRLYSPQGQDPAFEAAMRQLAANITSALVGEGAMPQLAQLMESPSLKTGQLHFFRGHDSLASRWVTGMPHDSEMAATLQLQPADQAAMGVYDTPGMSPATGPTWLFVVKYTTPARASVAHARLTEVARKAETPLGQNLVLGPLVGQYVFGSTTMGEYSRVEAAARGTGGDQYLTLHDLQNRLGR